MRSNYILYLLAATLMSCMGINKTVSKEEDEGNTETSIKNPMSIYTYKVVSITGDTIDLQSYKGKKILIVNTASECGYTPQYADLQKLHEARQADVTILGFPCNDFGGQEPGTEEQIQTFCTKNYGVTFQLFEKINVKGKDKHPLYEWLTDKNKNGWNSEEPGWNFCKYLINEQGELVNYFGSSVKPTDAAFLSALNKK